MENNVNSTNNGSSVELSQHVKVDIGSSYCIISCSKHRLPDFVDVVDNLIQKGWSVTSGITSDDGLVFQTLTKASKN